MMRRFIVGTFAIIGVLTFLIILILAFSLHRLSSPSLPLSATADSNILSLSLGDESLVETPHNGGLMALIEGHPLSVHQIIEGINHAAKDNHIKGILLTLEGNSLKIATIQEIRDAIKSFKETGKFIYTYANTFGELSNGTMGYYLASATSKIWMMPLGTLNFNGMIIEVPFAKKALEDLKLRPQVGRREEYKGFLESITESDFTPPYKENMQRLIDAFTSQIITDVASDRRLEVSEVQKILDSSPHLSKDAVSRKMIDEIGYKDQVKDAITQVIGKKPTYHDFKTYIHTLKNHSTGPKIAIIYAEGTISQGKTAKNPLSDDFMIDAGEIIKSIRDARENDTIKAIVLRIDSPGGNPIAAELINREMELTKSKKPIIVSMTNYAASAGYLIACNALKIVAQRATTTGSIGVFGGKMVTQAFWDYYGVHWSEIHSGSNAAIWSTGQDYSEQGRLKFNEYLDQVYDSFQDKVANGRALPREKVHQIAKGQVWTGIEAKENGLIDELGGLTKAIEIAKKEAGLSEDAPITLLHMPLPKSFLDMIFDRGQSNEHNVLAIYPSLRMVLQQLGAIFSSRRIEMKIDSIQ